MAIRRLQRTIESIATSDGAGVKLRRSIGSVRGHYLDPFLMLDEFSSDDAADYIAGFPSHPHRGFETVTYMLDGRMRHEDHLGHRGELTGGGVQWMTAGRGIIHSEMPQQDRGRMRGFQLWINLPRREKMKPAKYRDIPASEIPVVEVPGGGCVKVIAGTITVGGREIAGPIQGLTTDPTYLDVELAAGAAFRHSLASDYTAFVYPFEGSVEIGPEDHAKTLGTQRAGLTSEGEEILLRGGDRGGRALLIAGRPLREPVFQYGPFVMSTREEVEQAVRDYQNGTLTAARDPRPDTAVGHEPRPLGRH
jgi:redox-sensitive bicupin YhaK (pirin superfamily)